MSSGERVVVLAEEQWGMFTRQQAALRVAWLELAPSVPVWDRIGDQGVVSHRSAATLFGLGDLPADVHEFTIPVRRQTRRVDVRLHRGDIAAGVVSRGGLLTTRPARTVVDLLTDGADPAAVSTIVAESLDAGYDGPATFAQWLSAVAHRYRFSRGDGPGTLGWLLDLAGAADRDRWMAQAADAMPVS